MFHIGRKSPASFSDSQRSSHSSFFQNSVVKLNDSKSRSSDKSISVQLFGRSARVQSYENQMRTEEREHVAQVNTVEFLLDDPIACGFFKFYCELQFNVENVYFVVEVGKFRDIFAVDSVAWGGKDWRAIDKDVNLPGLPVVDVSRVSQLLDDLKTKKLFWPSTIVSISEVEQRMIWLWETFLSSKAEYEICVPAQVFQNTVKRLFLIHIYGDRVFDEALLDPLKTLKKDIYPRFIVSDLALEMQLRLDMLSRLPTADQLVVPAPGTCAVCNSIDGSADNTVVDAVNHLTLPQVLTDKIVYECFLSYLRSIMAPENLLCIRMIEFFKEQTPIVESKTKRVAGGTTGLSSNLSSYYHFESVNRAWIVYLFFVHPGSVYEVALSHRRRKELRLIMANPPNSCFDRLEKSAMDAVKVHFQEFRTNSTWKGRLTTAIQEYINEKKALATKEAIRRARAKSCCCWCF